MKNVLSGKPVQFLGVVLTIGVVWFLASNQEYVYKGSSYSPFPEAYNFELADQDGEAFELADQRDKVVLLFFGYTNCPDVCPTTLADFGRIREGLGEKADQVAFVFITEDPVRDTQERLKEYLFAFDPSIVGLTGDLEELRPVWDAYHVIPQIMPDADGSDDVSNDENYMVTHSSRIYVIDGTGRLRLTFPYDMEIDDMVQDILHLTRELE